MRAYVSDVSQFGTFVGILTRLELINRDTIEQWLLRLRRLGHKTATIQRKLASLRGFFQACVSRGHVTSTPFQGFRARLTAPVRLVRVIAEDDLYRLLQYTEQQVQSARLSLVGIEPLQELRNRAIVRTLASTGIRAHELVSLTLERISLESGALQVPGKGDRERLAFLISAPDIVPLAEYLSVRTTIPVNHSNVFVNSRGMPLSTAGVRSILNQLAQKCCDGRKITPHMFRHTAATRLLENGADMRVVQEFLGHASIRSTERYTHVSRRHLRSVLDRCHPLRSLDSPCSDPRI